MAREVLRQSPMMSHMLDALDEGEIRACVQQVEEKGCSPPSREKILEYQSLQDFPIRPNPDDPDACNVYNELQIPDDVYESIREYQEKRQTS
jgi:hypothetical protein